MASHIINSITLDFIFPAEEKTNALKKAKQFFNEEIIHQLNSSFDEVENDVYIEKLEIDIGNTTEENFADNFHKALTKALDGAEYRGRSYMARPHSSHFSLEQDPILYFLRKGHWPWNWQRKSFAEITTLIIGIWEKEEQVIVLLQQLSGNDISLAARLIDLVFPEPELRSLFIKALRQHHPALETTIAYFENDWIEQVVDGKAFYSLLLKEIIIARRLEQASDVKELLLRFVSNYVEETTADEQQRALQKIDSFLKSTGDLSGIDKALPLIKGLLDSSGESVTETHSYFTDEEKEKIQVGNAGLVLFHPYLPYVFRELKWTDATNNFIDRRSQQKAVLFLQHLINGKSRQAEHELVLNKILCNWPVNLPLATRSNFSAIEKQAAIELVDSLKEHWTVLGGTSREGVILSFVERRGQLQKAGRDYLLQVEQNTIDILMQSLPFGIQTIKLPWNEYCVHTEWVY